MPSTPLNRFYDRPSRTARWRRPQGLSLTDRAPRYAGCDLGVSFDLRLSFRPQGSSLEEDVRRSHRERGRLIHERTSHINRIKGLLFAAWRRSSRSRSITAICSCKSARRAISRAISLDRHSTPRAIKKRASQNA